MQWIKASIETTGPGVETVTAILMSCGITGVEIKDSKERAQYFADTARTWDYADESLLVDDSEWAYVVFYVTDNEAGNKLLKKVAGNLSAFSRTSTENIGSLTVRVERANDETWLHEWKKHFKPLRLGRVVVVPEWEKFAPRKGDIVFIIDPGSAFGTGQHQTTQLCISALQKWVGAGHKVLDVGCGSGILSIISLLLGAQYVCAIDVDPAGAVTATKKNAELNPIDLSKLKVMVGDVLSQTDVCAEVKETAYDVVVANIVADVIIPLAPLAREFAKPGGVFISSGIISERLDEVLEAYAKAGITVLAQEELEGWHCVVGRCDA